MMLSRCQIFTFEHGKTGSLALAPDRATIEFILDVERKRNRAAAKFKAQSFYDSTLIDELRKEE